MVVLSTFTEINNFSTGLKSIISTSNNLLIDVKQYLQQEKNRKHNNDNKKNVRYFVVEWERWEYYAMVV